MGLFPSTHSNSSKNDAKLGDEWKYKIYFDPDADNSHGDKYDNIQDENLVSKLQKLVGENEKITKVWTYGSPLNVRILPSMFHHKYVVFETVNWNWSIEKHSDGITIQRSKLNSKSVIDRYRQTVRHFGRKVIAEGEGRIGVCELIEWLYCEDELNSKYHYYFNNCKQFADRVFEFVIHPEAFKRLKHRFILDLSGSAYYDKKYRLTAKELLAHAMDCEGMKEDIKMTRLINVSLPNRKVREVLAIETKTWWWSIELLSYFYIIRRFDSENSFSDKCIGPQGQQGEYTRIIKEEALKMRMYDIVQFLCTPDKLKKFLSRP